MTGSVQHFELLSIKRMRLQKGQSDTKHNDIQHNYTQHYAIQHYYKKRHTQHNDIPYCYAECHLS